MSLSLPMDRNSNNVNYSDFLQSDSQKDQIKYMRQHLKFFLSKLQPPIVIETFINEIKSNTSPINDSFLQKWLYYLTTNATPFKKGKTVNSSTDENKLSYQTCISYFSAFKVFVSLILGRDAVLPNCMRNEIWSKYLSEILISKRLSSDGKSLVTPKERATEEDRNVIAAICVWNGSIDSAEFLLFNSTCYQCAGRGGEVSAIKFQDLSCHGHKDGETFRMKLTRHKTYNEVVNISIFPDRNNMLFDFYFAMGYYLILSHHTSSSMFPTFNDVLALQPNGRLNTSKVSRLFAKLFKKINDVVDDYNDLGEIYHRFNGHLGSHSNRKASFITLAESDIPFYNWIHRVGLTNRNINTMFDYVNEATERVDRLSGKTLSGWDVRVGGKIVGGILPTTRAISPVSKDKIEKLSSELFRCHINNGLSGEICLYLTASLIKYYDSFKSLLKREPLGKYTTESSLRSHPFLLRIHSSLLECGISLKEFETWKHKVVGRYINDNLIGLPLELIPEQYRHMVQIDFRTFHESLSMQEAQLGRLLVANSLLTRRIDNLETRNDINTQQIELLLTENRKQTRMLHKFLHTNNNENRNLVSIQKQNNVEVDIPEIKQLELLVDSTALWDTFVNTFKSPHVNYAGKFLEFFRIQNYESLYRSRSKGKKGERNLSMMIKTIIRAMLCLVGKVPPDRNAPNFEAETLVIATEAEKLLMQAIDRNVNMKTPTINWVLTKLDTLTLPDVPTGCPLFLIKNEKQSLKRKRLNN